MLAVFLVRFQKMISLFSSLRSCTLILFITVLSLRTSNGEDHKHEICSSSLISCGKLHNVSYPFWGLGRPKYCGHPVLQLECPTFPNHDGYPFLKIGEVYYEILSIDNNNNTLPIINIQLREFNKSIGYPHHISIKDFDTIFHYSESVEKITLHVCCGEEIEEIPSWFKTNTNWGNDCLAYYYPEKISSTNKFQGCHRLEVPVIKDWEILLHRNESVTLFEVLQQGFKVDYLNSLACSKCKNSSGTCGSNDEGFACFQRKPDWKLIVGIVIPGAFIIIGAVNIGVWCCIKRKFYSSVLQSSRLPYVSMKSDIEVGSSFYGIPVLPYNELREATKNFDESQELGDGGFGVVYYGKLKDGREVAVKRLFEKNYKQIENFMNEIEILTHLRHPNLVTLYGCTSRSSRELLLVYDFIPNGTVADHLYGQRKGSETLSWDIRMKIATETARALSYLHASDIIHRDVKTNNILLDKNFSVKVADFGLSRLFPCNATHVSTVPQGTPGYLDPQYHKNYQVTNKSDVYSFGVVLVELISSLPPPSFLILATLATSKGSESDYKSCSTLISCGKLKNVGYPFWGLGRPPYCGHPALQLHCSNESNDYPYLIFGDHKVHYHVLNIHNSSSSLRTIIHLQEFLETNSGYKSCPFHHCLRQTMTNLSIVSSLLFQCLQKS